MISKNFLLPVWYLTPTFHSTKLILEKNKLTLNRIEITETLLKNILLPEYKRLQVKYHFLKHIDPTPSKSKSARAYKIGKT